MTTSIETLKSLKLGQPLLIETYGGELLAGILKNINIKYLMIELDNARDIKTNYIYQSSQTLSYTQMKSIKQLLNEIETLNQTRNVNSDSDSINTAYSSVEKCDNLNINLTYSDLQLLQAQLDSTKFIKQDDYNYRKALNDIKRQTVIGLSIDPIQMGRNCKTSLIAVSTIQNIYVFDMLSLGKIFNEFRLILESERPKKIVHYSHKIVDHLKYRHDVLLKGVFDTFLAYCVITGEKTNLTLEETIQKTFSISNVYFESNAGSNLPVNMYLRPLPHEQLIIVAKKVAFQLKLYDYLLHEQMLRNFYKQCEKFSQIFCNNDDNFEVGQQLHPHSRAGYEHIQPNGNWKDKLNIEFEIFRKK